MTWIADCPHDRLVVRRRPCWGRSGLVALAVLTACASPPRWNAEDRPDRIDVRRLLESQDSGDLFRHMHASEIPEIPIPTHLRPCCGFGADLRVRIGPVPIPGFRLSNILGPTDLGHHRYDSGILAIVQTPDDRGETASERNGLVYTCRGGFIDTAHVRDWVDWTIFIGTTIARNLEQGITIPLPPEGGARVLRIAPGDPRLIDRIGRRRATIPLAQWLAFQLSVWHEIITWFGWSHYAAFPELASAFSPEDLYSNAIGIKIMGAVAAQRTARTEPLFNESVDHWLAEVLRGLEAVPRELGIEAARSLDGFWWDSEVRLPSIALVRKRNLDLSPLLPWLLPADRMPETLRSACGVDPQPLVLGIPEAHGGAAFWRRATLEIEIAEELASREPFASVGRRITQADFPAIIEFIRAQVRSRFGPEADRPD